MKRRQASWREGGGKIIASNRQAHLCTILSFIIKTLKHWLNLTEKCVHQLWYLILSFPFKYFKSGNLDIFVYCRDECSFSFDWLGTAKWEIFRRMKAKGRKHFDPIQTASQGSRWSTLSTTGCNFPRSCHLPELSGPVHPSTPPLLALYSCYWCSGEGWGRGPVLES